MKTLYGTCRFERIGNIDLQNLSLNGTYTMSFYLNPMFGDWNEAGLTNIIDTEISEEKYIGEIAPGIKKLTRFFRCEYNENYVDGAELERSIKNLGGRFNAEIINDLEVMSQWIRDNTSLVEVTPGKFILSEETEFNGEIIPAKYLEIN